MIFTIYKELTRLAKPLLIRNLQKRVKIGKEDKYRLTEKQGIASWVRPNKPIVWIHGASIGEALSYQPIIDEINSRNLDVFFLMTTCTLSSANLLTKFENNNVKHQFLPLDSPEWVESFLDYWKPDIGIWVESELWPNLIFQSKSHGVKMFLLNARMSEKSKFRWKLLKSFFNEMMGCFEVILAQSEQDYKNLLDLGVSNVKKMHNLKYSVVQVADEEFINDIMKIIVKRRILVFASTWAGEEKIALDIHLELKEIFPDLLTIIAPRHITRSNDIAKIISTVDYIKLSQLHEIVSEIDIPDIIIWDEFGKMAELFKIANLIVIGKSFTKKGGQNPIEAVKSGRFVLWGENMQNFSQVAIELEEAKLGKSVKLNDLKKEIANNFGKKTNMTNNDLFKNAKKDLKEVVNFVISYLPLK